MQGSGYRVQGSGCLVGGLVRVAVDDDGLARRDQTHHFHHVYMNMYIYAYIYIYIYIYIYMCVYIYV